MALTDEAGASTPERAAIPTARLTSIDALRGLVMAVMLLDHMRDFVHRDSLLMDPLDLERTTPILFATRWITHFCAPVFVFLAGVSARIQLDRGMPARELSGWLARRGAFLIALELVVLRPLIWFNFDGPMVAHLQVIWAIGGSMLMLALLLRGPLPLAGIFGVVVVAGHNLLDRFEGGESSPTLWALLHRRQRIPIGDELGALALYPLLPWMGVLALGFGFGVVFARETAARRRRLAFAGVGAMLAFVALRAWGGYGDPLPFEPQDSATFSLMSFVNTQKYPPSLLFTLMTLGPALCLLALLDREPSREPAALARPFIVLGRVPLFFYLLQWPTVHFAAWILQALTGQPFAYDTDMAMFFGDPPEGVGFSLATTYAAWIGGLIALWPLCLWFSRFKARHRDWRWLSYL